MVKTANAAEDAAVTMTPRRNLVTTGTLSMKDILTDMAARSVPFLDGTAHE